MIKNIFLTLVAVWFLILIVAKFDNAKNILSDDWKAIWGLIAAVDLALIFITTIWWIWS